MSGKRKLILDWAEAGHIQPEKVDEALSVNEANLMLAQWQSFVKNLLLFLGVTAFCSGVIFFFAYNWEYMGRLLKFALVEVIFIAMSLTFAFTRPSSQTLRTAITTGIFLLTGSILALIGQTYQTGADPWQLFATWAVLNLLLVLVSRSSLIWIMGLAVCQLAMFLYFHTFRNVWWFFSYGELSLCIAVVFNSLLALFLEGLYQKRAFGQFLPRKILDLCGLNNRYAAQISVMAAGMNISILAFMYILDWQRFSLLFLLIYVAWISLCLHLYRFKRRDLLLVSACVLSMVVIIITAFARIIFESKFFGGNFDGGGFFLLAVVTVAISTPAVLWLKKLSGEEPDEITDMEA